MKSVADIKSEIHRFVAKTDDLDSLKELEGLIQDLMSKEEEIMIYTSKGVPLDRESYKRDIDSAIQEVKNGQVVDIEEVEKGFE